MATPKPGEIRCPTCHRSTPPAAFCTQCGSAIPSDARARPRGMDRDELQERIRARRTGGDPWRRGAVVDDDTGGYERFVPEPEDARAVRGPRGTGHGPRRDFLADRGPEGAAPGPRPDLTRETDDWAPTAPVAPVAPDAEPRRPDNFDDEAYADAGYAYADEGYDDDDWDEARGRRSGGGALAIVGFLALGVLALLGGALLANVFSPGVGEAPSPTPTPAATVAVTPSPSAEATDQATPSATTDATDPPDDGEPVEFPDGFIAEAQPCLPGSAGSDGCDSNAERNAGAVQIWVGFRNGTAADVIGAALIGPEGNTVGTGSIDLADINCGASCNGYTYFNFANLEPGEYRVEITRNGERADTTSFIVE